MEKNKSKNQPENRQFFHENRQLIKVYRQATEAPYALHLPSNGMEWNGNVAIKFIWTKRHTDIIIRELRGVNECLTTCAVF